MRTSSSEANGAAESVTAEAVWDSRLGSWGKDMAGEAFGKRSKCNTATKAQELENECGLLRACEPYLTGETVQGGCEGPCSAGEMEAWGEGGERGV